MLIPFLLQIISGDDNPPHVYEFHSIETNVTHQRNIENSNLKSDRKFWFPIESEQAARHLGIQQNVFLIPWETIGDLRSSQSDERLQNFVLVMPSSTRFSDLSVVITIVQDIANSLSALLKNKYCVAANRIKFHT